MEYEGSKPTVLQRARDAATFAWRDTTGTLTRLREEAAERASSREGLCAGVRLCQLYLLLVLLGALGYALITAPANFDYDFSLVHGFLAAALTSVSIWMLQKRAVEGRTFAIASVVALTALSAGDMFLFGAFDVVSARLGAMTTAIVLIAQYASAAALVVYLDVSPRARQVLSVPLDRRPIATEGYSFDAPLKQRVRTWVFWRDLMIYFIVFSFMGHWAEMLFCFNIHLGVFMGDVDFSEVMLWHQWLFPYCAEGVAVVLIAVLLTPVKQWLLKRFDGRVLPAVLLSIVVTAVVCTTIDFTCGMICNQNYEVWDYRALPFNFMGQVCLQNSTVYTVAATLILWIFYPLMDRALRRMPRAVSDGLFFALLGIYAFSALLHFMYVGDTGLVVGAFEMKPQ